MIQESKPPPGVCAQHGVKLPGCSHAEPLPNRAAAAGAVLAAADPAGPPGQLQRHVRHHSIWGSTALLPRVPLDSPIPQAFQYSGNPLKAYRLLGRAFKRISARSICPGGRPFRVRSFFLYRRQTGHSLLHQVYVHLRGFLIFHFPITPARLSSEAPHVRRKSAFPACGKASFSEYSQGAPTWQY